MVVDLSLMIHLPGPFRFLNDEPTGHDVHYISDGPKQLIHVL